MNKERIAELRIEALNAKYAGKEFAIQASEAMEILNLAMNQLEPRVTPEMWKELGRIEVERTTAPVSLTDAKIEELAIKHESFGFGQAGKKSKLSIHGFEPEGLREFARALLAAAPAPIQKEPEATHKRQVFMDEIDAAKAGSEWLEPFFGPGFRLSFSVDEGARAPQAKWCMLFDSLDRVVAGYMLTRDAKNWTELIKVGPHATPPALAGSHVQAAGDARKRVARAIWNLRREDEDRCDMELEDMGDQHSVWAEAEAAIAAMREQQT